MPIFSKDTFQVLKTLTQNNNKEWFAENKTRYEESVRRPFAALLEQLTESLSGTSVPFRGGEKTMFRVNRDVRFSNDKSPYSTHVSGLLTPSGTKSEANALVYIHLDLNGGFCVAGLYHPSTDRLEELRNAMIEKPAEFSALLDQLAKTGLELDSSEATKTMPRAFTDFAGHQLASQIKLKNLMVRKEFSKADLVSDSLVNDLKKFALDSAQLLDFIGRN